MNFAPAIVSPCIKVCTMDPATGLCAGCGRTLDEIARWGGMSNAEREAIMRELPARRARDKQPR
ncbi:MAG TPA: DUF1289 domain-containing protein [Rhizomicrobium sp.]|nr:DUF1289 domain-containing protein [Rhizomicrobium sp.]